MKNNYTGRRNFLKTATAFTGAMAGLSLLPNTGWAHPVAGGPAADSANSGSSTGALANNIASANPAAANAAENSASTPADDLNIIGPKEGYSPQIGTVVSMMAWLRPQVIGSIKPLSVEQLDWLIDEKANTIGALAYHLAATDFLYHQHTFNNVTLQDLDKALGDKFGPAMNLGDEGRKKIKGNNAQFYIDILTETRNNTLTEFKKRDDKWLMAVDDKFPWGPTNNYCKWFHVTEHESHHLGQINLLKSRVPGAKSSNNNG